MKRVTSICLVILLLGLGNELANPGTLIGATPVDSTAMLKANNASFMLGRYVIGSGGVFGANSPNYIHHGTAGQMLIGGAHSSNYFLLSGFWSMPARPSAVDPIDKLNLPTTFLLHQNFPNPFNPETTIEYDLPQTCRVMVEIFNTKGQRMRLVCSQVQGPGRAMAVWDGRDDQEKTMGSGVYFYRVTAFAMYNIEKNQPIQFQQTKKMLLVK